MSAFFAALAGLGEYFGGIAYSVVLTYSGSLSLWSLGSALCIACAFIVWQRLQKRKKVRVRSLFRALFPRRMLLSPSAKADYAFTIFNSMMVGILFGWAILSFATISMGTSALLAGVFGTVAPTQLPATATSLVTTLVIFLAYEFGYWVDHYLKHRVPALWEFHKVHHQAEVLTPLTVFRMHPGDSIVFYNIIAVATGLANGALCYVFGKQITQFTIESSNFILAAFGYITLHLQHTHVWIPFTGWLGRILLSPAHHQIHHSLNPIHFDRNFGGCLSLFDWIFGTLHMPAKEREQITFGVAPEDGDPHSVTGTLITPVIRALAHLKPLIPAGWALTPGRSDA